MMNQGKLTGIAFLVVSSFFPLLSFFPCLCFFLCIFVIFVFIAESNSKSYHIHPPSSPSLSNCFPLSIGGYGVYSNASAPARGSSLQEMVAVRSHNNNPRAFLSYHLISSHTISCRIISSHTISCRIISYHTISCRIISYHTISYHIISYHIKSLKFFHLSARLT